MSENVVLRMQQAHRDKNIGELTKIFAENIDGHYDDVAVNILHDFVNVAVAYTDLHEASLHCFDKLHLIQQMHEIQYQNYCALLLKFKKYDELHLIVNFCVERYPTNIILWQSYCVLYQRLGNQQNLISAYQRAFSAIPDINEFLMPLAYIYYENRAFEANFKLLNDNYDRGKENIDFLILYAEICDYYGLYEKAADAITICLEISPDEIRQKGGYLTYFLHSGRIEEYYREVAATRLDLVKHRNDNLLTKRGALKIAVHGRGGPDDLNYGRILNHPALKMHRLYFITQIRFKEIFEHSFENLTVIDKDKWQECDESQFDCQFTSVDLCFLLNYDFMNPLPPPYFKYNKGRRDEYGNYFAKKYSGKIIIGLSWQSANNRKNTRNIDLNALTPLAKLENIVWVNLQYDCPHPEHYEISNHMDIVTIDGLDIKNDFLGLVSLMAACDMIVSVQNLNLILSTSINKPAIGLLSPLVQWHYSEKIAPNHHPRHIFIRRHSYQSWDDVAKKAAIQIAKIFHF